MSLIQSTTGTDKGQTASGSDAITQAMGGTELGQMFTKLLVAQVQYQDPLEPTDSSAFVTQLTQLSQTESLQTLTSQLKTQSSILDSLQTMQLGSQVGSTVMVAADSVQLDGKPLQGVINLPQGASLTLELTDAAGQVRTVALGQQSAGDVPFSIDPAALGLPAGRYQLAVRDADFNTYTAEVAGRLEAVRLTSAGTVALQVQGLGNVMPGAVTRFVGGANADTDTAGA